MIIEPYKMRVKKMVDVKLDKKITRNEKDDVVEWLYQDLPAMDIPKEGMKIGKFDIWVYECLDIEKCDLFKK